MEELINSQPTTPVAWRENTYPIIENLIRPKIIKGQGLVDGHYTLILKAYYQDRNTITYGPNYELIVPKSMELDLVKDY